MQCIIIASFTVIYITSYILMISIYRYIDRYINYVYTSTYEFPYEGDRT